MVFSHQGKRIVANGITCERQVVLSERLGSLPQCSPLPVVVVVQTRLSGVVHHVVLFTGAVKRRADRGRLG